MDIDIEFWATISAIFVPVALWFGSRWIAPRRRLSFQFDEPVEINPKNQSDDFELVVRHRGADISAAVYSILLTIRNVGNRDVCRDDFVEPTKVSFGKNFNILSCRFSAPKGFIFDKTEESLGYSTLRWNLLKARQRITLKFIVSAEESGLEIMPRGEQVSLIKDVRSDDVHPILSFCSGFVTNFLFILIITTVLKLLSINVVPQSAVFKSPEGETYVLAETGRDEVKWCHTLDTIWENKRCVHEPASSLTEFSYAGFERVRWYPAMTFSVGWFLWYFATAFAITSVEQRKRLRRLISD